MSKSTKTFVFAFVMCVVCSVVLSIAAIGLRPAQELNELIDRQKNVLKSLDLLPMTKKIAGEEVQSIYKSKINEMFIDSNGELTQTKSDKPIFIVYNEEKIKKYAIPIKAYGLWSWIYGYLALDGDGETIVGFTVYSHAETPGLGAEVEKDWFQKQFVGKKITDVNHKFESVTVVKGKLSDYNIPEESYANYVDGISGATITGKGVEKYMKIDLEKYEMFSSKLRTGV